MADYVIGIDIGTGSTKALAIDGRGKTISTSQIHYPTSTPSADHCEQDPEIVWSAFVQAIRSIVKSIGKNPGAIILSSAMHSVIPVDREGRALHSMIIWADNRSADIATRVVQSAIGELLYEQNGTPIHAMTPLCKIIWLRENKNRLFKSIYKFISIKEFIWFKLFNRFDVDHSIASATGLMNIESLAWNESALHLCEITADQLSDLQPVAHTLNCQNDAVCRELLLDRDTPFVIGASDGCFANLGSFATEPGVAALTIGTSGAIRLAGKSPVYNFSAMTFNYRLNEHIFISGGPVNNGGVALKWYINNFLGQKLDSSTDYEKVLASIAEIPPGSDGIVFLPYLYGDRAPIWNSNACGAFFGMKNYHTQPHFTRAVIEGISFSLFDVADHMMRSGTTIEKIHVSGGFVSSQAWLQILANIFGKKICLYHHDDASAFGAAILGLQRLRMINDPRELQPAEARELHPDPAAHRVYKKVFERYRKLYIATKDIMND